MIAGVMQDNYPNLTNDIISNVDLTLARKLFLKSSYALYKNKFFVLNQLIDNLCIALGIRGTQDISNWPLKKEEKFFLNRLRKISEKYKANLLFFYKSFCIIDGNLYIIENNTLYFVGELGYNHRVMPMYRFATEKTEINAYIQKLYWFLKDKDCEDPFVAEKDEEDDLIYFAEHDNNKTLMKTALYWAIKLVKVSIIID